MNKDLKNFYQRIRRCQYCPQDLTVGWGTPGNILFIDAQPKQKREHVMFQRFLISLLWKVGVRPDDFFYTSMSKTPYDKELRGDHLNKIKHQWNHIIDEINIIKPEIIISYGSLVDKVLTEMEIIHYPIIHPSAINDRSITEDEWIEKLGVIINKYIKQNGKKNI